MSQQNKLERILDFLVNEEAEQAEELLHDLVVEKARNIYESLVNEEDDEEEEMDESIGGDPKADFVGEIESAREDIETDELNDGEMELGGEEEFGAEPEGEIEMDIEGGDEFGGDMDMDMEELPVEDQVEELSDQLAALRQEFDMLMADELEEPNHSAEEFGMEEPEGEIEMEVDMDSDDEAMDYVESMYEATKLQDEVASPGMEQEGKLAGTGKNSKVGATGKESPYTKAPSKSISGSKAVDFTKGGDEAGGSGDSAKDDTPGDNIKVDPKNVNNGEQKTDGAFVGTGKNTPKGKTNTKSPLTTAPKKP